ncbi:MAG: hypothetical protein WA175_04160 [Candidatus Acidiferrales bacterium]
MTMIVRLLVLLLATPFWARAGTLQTNPEKQTVRDVHYCDIIHNPKAYDGNFLRVRAYIRLEFETSSIYMPGCSHGPDSQGKYLTGIWPIFGGDESEAGTYSTANSQGMKKADVQINGVSIPLVRDSEYLELRKRLDASRNDRPDGQPCNEYGECRFYRVSATLTGYFFARKGEADSIEGYGHLGCCHLFVIEQVSDVSTGRTKIPAGGEFDCPRQEWDVPPADVARLKISEPCPQGLEDKDCELYEESAFARIAQHWNDVIEPKDGQMDGHAGATYGDHDVVWNWTSADLLTRYETITRMNAEGPPLGEMDITRQACRRKTGKPDPLPSSKAISCERHSRSWTEDEDAAKKYDENLAESEKRESSERADEGLGDAQKSLEDGLKIMIEAKHLYSDGDQSWRLGDSEMAAWHALREQLGLWRVAEGPGLHLDKCNDQDFTDSYPASSCTWYSADGMREFDVGLLKYKASSKQGVGSETPWIVTDVYARICSAESQGKKEAEKAPKP